MHLLDFQCTSLLASLFEFCSLFEERNTRIEKKVAYGLSGHCQIRFGALMNAAQHYVLHSSRPITACLHVIVGAQKIET